MAFSPDGRWLATCGANRTARIWDVATGKELRSIPQKVASENPGAGHPRLQAVAFSPDSRWLATGSADCTARIFEVASGRELRRVTHDPGVNDVAFSPDGRWLATGGGNARIWDAHSGEELLRVGRDAAMGDAPTTVAFSPDGRLLVTGGLDKTARAWRLHEGPMTDNRR